MSDEDLEEFPGVREILEHYQHAYENVDDVGLAQRMTPAERSLHADVRQSMRTLIENLQHRVDHEHTGGSRRHER